MCMPGGMKKALHGIVVLGYRGVPACISTTCSRASARFLGIESLGEVQSNGA